MTTLTITKATPPEWLLASRKEIDDKTFVEVLTASRRMRHVASVSLNGMDVKRSVKTFGPSFPALVERTAREEPARSTAR